MNKAVDSLRNIAILNIYIYIYIYVYAQHEKINSILEKIPLYTTKIFDNHVKCIEYFYADITS